MMNRFTLYVRKSVFMKNVFFNTKKNSKTVALIIQYSTTLDARFDCQVSIISSKTEPNGRNVLFLLFIQLNISISY